MVKWIFLVTCLLAFEAQGQKSEPVPSVTLTQKDAAEMVLRQGFRTKEINYDYQTKALEPIEALSVYDWTLTLESGQQKDRLENYALYGDVNVERYISKLGLKKSLLTGTSLDLTYTRTSQNRISPPDLTTPVHHDLVSLTLEQNLWGNFFGIADRATVRAAETSNKANLILRVDQLEDLVLETLRLYWDTYVAQENFKEALATKERYEKLVQAVRRKANVGYANPGEYSQIQAAFEERIQTVKTASTTYLANLENLNTLLGLPPNTEIKFSVSKDLPPVPQLKSTPIEERRSVVSQKLKVEAAEDSLKAAKSKKYPEFKLVGRMGRSGLADGQGEAFSEVTSGTHPETYVGVKFAYNFGSDVQSAREFSRQAAYELERVRYERTLLEAKNKDSQFERNVATTYAVAQSAKAEKEFREKAVRELNRTYNQGRTDISVLIEAMNLYYAAEIKYVRAIGNYQIALNEWAAARDELIPNKEEK